MAAPAGARPPGPPQIIPDAEFRVVEVPAAPVRDWFPGPTLAPRPGVVAPVASVIATQLNQLVGRASWYCRAGVSVCHYQYPDTAGFDAYAAAGPKLRAALGNWRGRVVQVCGKSTCIAVRLVDWCQCYKDEASEKLIDLYYDVFVRTGGSVTLLW